MTERGRLTRRGALAALGAAGAAACARKPDAPRYVGRVSFNHGVASGDPRSDRVVIWTRVTPERDGPVPVRWIVARNRGLTEVVQTGIVETDARRDFTVKVDVPGLRPGAPYFYGFRAGDGDSDVGRTRTLTEGRLEQMKIAVASCASYAHGFFNVYEAMSREDDLDLVVHLGDYIYEYGVAGYGGETAMELGRIPSPEIECLSLGDYRLRHAQYKGEPELQAAHAKCPWICVWDDHEIANDCFIGGAENHNPENGEGVWTTRKRAALQAYYEWMPIREPEPGRPFESINRSFQFGDLMTLAMVETRLLSRTRPLDYARDMPLVEAPWDFSNPSAPARLASDAPRGPNVRMLPAPFEEVDGQLRVVTDWARVQAAIQSPGALPEGLQWAPDTARLARMLDAEDRQMLGPEQEGWLARTLDESKESETVWQVIGNQVMVAPVIAPDLHRAPAAVMRAADAAQPGASRLMQFTRWPIPLSTDSWDGYPRARGRLYEMLRRVNGATIVLTGDTHAAWANELVHEEARVGVEFGASSVTSPGAGDLFAPAGLDFASGIRARNPHVRWTQHTKRGYVRLTLERRRATAEFIAVSTVTSKGYRVSREAGFVVEPARGGGLSALTAVDDRGRALEPEKAR